MSDRQVLELLSTRVKKLKEETDKVLHEYIQRCSLHDWALVCQKETVSLQRFLPEVKVIRHEGRPKGSTKQWCCLEGHLDDEISIKVDCKPQAFRKCTSLQHRVYYFAGDAPLPSAIQVCCIEPLNLWNETDFFVLKVFNPKHVSDVVVLVEVLYQDKIIFQWLLDIYRSRNPGRRAYDYLGNTNNVQETKTLDAETEPVYSIKSWNDFTSRHAIISGIGFVQTKMSSPYTDLLSEMHGPTKRRRLEIKEKFDRHLLIENDC